VQYQEITTLQAEDEVLASSVEAGDSLPGSVAVELGRRWLAKNSFPE
jgi:hypothetical protein